MPSPYMPLYIADYMADTAHLSTLEHGAYLLLIMTYWQTGKPLPNDRKKLARICRVDLKNYHHIEENLISFFTVVNDKLHHLRIDDELLIYKEKCEKSRLAGIKSGESRRSKRSTDAERTLNGRSSLVEPQTNHSESYTDTYKETTSKACSKEKSPKRKIEENKKILEAFSVTDEHIAYASENGLPHPDSKIEQFKTHHLARTKSLKEISDWKLAFYNWLRNAKDYQQQRVQTHETNQRTAPKSKSHELWTELAADLVRGTEHEHLYPGKA